MDRRTFFQTTVGALATAAVYPNHSKLRADLRRVYEDCIRPGPRLTFKGCPFVWDDDIPSNTILLAGDQWTSP